MRTNTQAPSRIAVIGEADGGRRPYPRALQKSACSSAASSSSSEPSGRYSVEKLIAEHGDAKLTDLLMTLADCSRARSVSVHDRCKAVYEGL